MRAMYWSVSFCTSPCSRRTSSSERPSPFWRCLTSSLASLRTWRTATRPSSASLCSIFTYSLRRSSVSAGIGTRTIVPSLDGFSPRSDSRIAFSMSLMTERSHGVIVSIRGSGAETVPTWFSGTREPYASTRIESRSAGLAFPVRTEPNSRRMASRALSIRCLAVVRLDMAVPVGRERWSPRWKCGSVANQGPDPLAAHHAGHGARVVQVQHHHRDVVVLAERERRGVHHPQLLRERVQERDLGDEGGGGVLDRVGRVDPVHLGGL